MAGGFKVFRFSITHTALVYAAVLIFSTGGGLPQPGLPFFATETLHATTAGLGVLSIATASGLLLSSILGGYISDKIGRPPVIIACFLVDACCVLLLPLSRTMAMLVILRFLMGFTNAGLNMCGAFMADILSPETPESEKNDAQARVSLSTTIGILFGSISSTFFTSFLRACVFGALLELLAFGIALFSWNLRARPPPLQRAREGASRPERQLDVIRRHLRKGPFFRLCIAQFAFGLGQSPVDSTLPVLVQIRTGASSGTWSRFHAEFVFATVFAQAMIAPRLMNTLGSTHSVAIPMLLLALINLAFAALGRSLLVLVVLMMLFGMAGGCLGPAISSLSLSIVSAEVRGTLMGFLGMANQAGRVAGPYLLNAFFEHSPLFMYLCCAVAIGLAAFSLPPERSLTSRA